MPMSQFDHNKLRGHGIGRVMKLADYPFSKARIPFISLRVPAGEPSQRYADDIIHVHFPFNFFPEIDDGYVIEVSGNSMMDAGIDDGDLLLVNRGAQAEHKDIVVASINGEMTVKRFMRDDDKIYFMPANPDYKTIAVTSKDDVEVFGVVIRIIKKPR